jgi:hypothetical protein
VIKTNQFSKRGQSDNYQHSKKEAGKCVGVQFMFRISPGLTIFNNSNASVAGGCMLRAQRGRECRDQRSILK